MIRLYLHQDLCKATNVPAGRAQGVEDQTMRVRQTSHRKTGGQQRMVGRMERDYHTSVANKAPYKCKGCGDHVIPPREKKVQNMTAEQHADHLAAGSDVSYSSKHKQGVVTSKPKKITSEGKRVQLDHGDVTSEMLPSRSTTGKQMRGSCPSCHASGQAKTVASAVGKTPEDAAAKLKDTAKSLDMLDGMMYGMGVPVEKSLGVRLVLDL